jgi:hypothetical protein
LVARTPPGTPGGGSLHPATATLLTGSAPGAETTIRYQRVAPSAGALASSKLALVAVASGVKLALSVPLDRSHWSVSAPAWRRPTASLETSP